MSERERYYISELRGFKNIACGKNGNEGITFTIHDSLELCREVTAFRSEDRRWQIGNDPARRTRAHKEANCRAAAEKRCSELNAL